MSLYVSACAPFKTALPPTGALFNSITAYNYRRWRRPFELANVSLVFAVDSAEHLCASRPFLNIFYLCASRPFLNNFFFTCVGFLL